MLKRSGCNETCVSPGEYSKADGDMHEVGDPHDEHGLAGVNDCRGQMNVFRIFLRRLVHGRPREVLAEFELELRLGLELVLVRVDRVETDRPDAVLEVAGGEHGNANL
jgi:hypothetical protein